MDNSITSFSVLSSTNTTLYARWFVVTNSSDAIEGFIFEFESNTNELFEYNLTRVSVVVYQNDAFEYNFTNIQNSQTYTLEATAVTNMNSFTSMFSICKCE